jgi:hypothetical protein
MTSSDACNANSFGVERYSGGTFVTYRSIGTTSTNYTIMGDISENTDTEDREEMMVVTINGQRCNAWFKVKQAGKSSTQCTCGTVSGRLNIGATATGGVPLGSFNGSNDCSASDYKVVKGSEETIVNIANTTISKSGSIYRVYANVTNTNTGTSPRTQTLLVQKVSDGQMCGGPFVIEQQGTTPLCVVDLMVSKASTSDCGVHFKVKETCSSIGTYDVIEWGCSTNNTPVFDQQAFGAISATGDGITQDANVDSTTFTNYHIWWRNRQAPAVSGTTVIQLKKCEHHSTYTAIVQFKRYLNDGEEGTVDWGDGSEPDVFYSTSSQAQHEYLDGTTNTALIWRSNPPDSSKAYQRVTLSPTVTSATICDCDAVPSLSTNYVFFQFTGGTMEINVNPNKCNNMYVRNGDASATWCNTEFINDGKTLKLTIANDTTNIIRHTTLFYGVRAGTAQDPTSSRYECNWLYVGQGGIATCNSIYQRMQGESFYLQFNDTTTTIFTDVKCANIKNIEPSDITYNEYDPTDWDPTDYERYGTNWITGCTWLPNGGLKIDTTVNYSGALTKVARGASIKIKLMDDSETTCATIYIHQYCQTCTNADSRGEVTENDNS